MKRRQTLSRKKREEKQRERTANRLANVLEGLELDLSVKEIHYRTKISEKNVRKIMLKAPSEFTFRILQRQRDN